MNKIMLKIALVLSLLLPAVAEENDKKSLMVVVTSSDVQTQLMSMVLSTHVFKKGADLNILFCGPAGDLVLKDSKETILKPKNKSPQMLLKNLIKNKVKVEVCPLYLPNKGKSVEDLLEGVTVAKPPMIADMLLEDDRKILSY